MHIVVDKDSYIKRKYLIYSLFIIEKCQLSIHRLKPIFENRDSEQCSQLGWIFLSQPKRIFNKIGVTASSFKSPPIYFFKINSWFFIFFKVHSITNRFYDYEENVGLSIFYCYRWKSIKFRFYFRKWKWIFR